MNNQGLSFTNIIINLMIIAGLAWLGYWGYENFFLNKPLTTEPIINENGTTMPTENTADKNQTTPPAGEKNVPPTVDTKPSPLLPPRDIVTPIDASPTPPADANIIFCPGLYRNYTYFYSLECPTSWPLKVRGEADVSIGSIPPKNGLGAITIEVSGSETDNELEMAKTEAAKYPGMIAIQEEPAQLDGQTGNKITLDYLVTGNKSFYILVPYASLNYLIKYSAESDAFVKEVENILNTFKFE